MTVQRRLLAVGICAVALGGMVIPMMRAAEAPKSADALKAELKAAEKEFDDVMPISEITDAEYRKKEGAKAIVPLKKMVNILTQIQAQEADPDVKKDIEGGLLQFKTFLAALGDDGAQKELTALSSGGDAGKAFAAKSALALANWWDASGDAKAQDKQLDDYIALAKANAANDDAAITLMEMGNLGAANKDLMKKAYAVIKDDLTSQASKGIRTQIVAAEAQEQEVLASVKAQSERIGQPFAVEGRTSTGGQFSIASMKGKVVIIDFWATWCGPCRAKLPELKEIYEKYHGKGLEVIGVSCDGDEDALNSFASENGMPWVEMHEKDIQAGDDTWHPLTHKLGIMMIPTMYLVDKKGVLRDVEADEDLDKKVSDLLAEKDGAATQPTK